MNMIMYYMKFSENKKKKVNPDSHYHRYKRKHSTCEFDTRMAYGIQVYRVFLWPYMASLHLKRVMLHIFTFMFLHWTRERSLVFAFLSPLSWYHVGMQSALSILGSAVEDSAV